MKRVLTRGNSLFVKNGINAKNLIHSNHIQHRYFNDQSSSNPTTTSTDTATATPTTEPQLNTTTQSAFFRAQTQGNSKKEAPTATSQYEYPKEREEALEKSFEYCISELSNEEPQIYDTLKYIKCTEQQRLAITVLRTLHLELSRVRSDSDAASAAKIRLQWWHSSVSEVINEKSAVKPMKESAPILQALRVIRRRYNLNSQWLLSLVESRQSFLESNTFMSLLELEEYAESTQSLLLYLSMECMEVAYSSSNAQNHFKCASHIGVFMTIASVLRSIPLAARSGFIALPDDVAADHDVWRFEQVVLKEFKSTLQLKSAVQFMVECAYNHYYAAKDLEKTKIPDNVKSLFLCCVPAHRYLRHLEKRHFDVFDDKLMHRSDMGISWRMEMLKKSVQGTF